MYLQYACILGKSISVRKKDLQNMHNIEENKFAPYHHKLVFVQVEKAKFSTKAIRICI